MADNIAIPGLGEEIATRETGGAHHQKDIVEFVDSAGEPVLVSTQTPLPTRTVRGQHGYAAGTSAATVQVPNGARLRSVSVVAGSAPASVTIGFGQTIAIPAAAGFNEQIVGDFATPPSVTFGGSIASYYVSWEV